MPLVSNIYSDGYKLRQELVGGSGAKLIGGLNYVTPEMSGLVTGQSNADDDTAAIQWALNQNAAQVVLDSTKTYNIQPGVIKHVGKVNVDAGAAKIVCDGIAIDIIDGAGSVWKGGELRSKSTPWTVVYDKDFNIIESGYLGYGRMPYQEAPGVDENYWYQQISCILVFRSSSSNVLDGLTVSGVHGSYANIVAAGYKNTTWTNCFIRGGALSGSLLILNDCQMPITAGFGWNAGVDFSYLNPFKWGRGSNHSVIGGEYYESRQMGLCINGSDVISLVSVKTYDNAESGIQTGQYSAAYPHESIISKHITQVACQSWGNFYDGFDHASVTTGANGPYFNKHLTMTNNESYGNRFTGMYVQGGYLQFGFNNFHDNGRHGISLTDSSTVDISTNRLTGNGRLTGGYQLVATGTDVTISGNTITRNTSITNSALVNINVGKQAKKNFGVRFLDSDLSELSTTYTVIGNGVTVNLRKETASGNSVECAGVRSATYLPKPIAGNTEARCLDEEAGAVAAWKHPYSGAFLRLYTNDMSQAQSAPFAMAYNHGKNTVNTGGYADNAGLGGTMLSYYPTSFRFDVFAAGAPTVSAGGVSLGAGGISPTVDNRASLGATSLRWAQLYAANSTINTSDATHKTIPKNPSPSEVAAFYEMASLPWVWQWLDKYRTEGDGARLHSGPTVQAAIEIMDKHGLNWTDYSVFCYDSWPDGTNDDGSVVSAGGVYSFRKEELLLWILRATVEKQQVIEERLLRLESTFSAHPSVFYGE